MGRTFVMYQGDYRDRFPYPWTTPKGSFGSGLYNKKGEFKISRFLDPDWDDYENVQTVGLCLYLFVRHENTDPKSFLCPQAQNDEPMSLEEIVRFRGDDKVEFFRDLRDFQSMANLSYSYQDPWSTFGVSEDTALLADKSNAYDTETGAPNQYASDFPIQNLDGAWGNNKDQNSRHGNSRNHRGEYQNVLFMNWSVKKFDTPCVGLAGDNIYTYWTNNGFLKSDKLIGRWDKGHARDRLDSYLGN
ncbi:hypothetical protein ACFL02_09455 [Planctomycetota bacterium]